MKKVGYIKPNFVVWQKNLQAQWAFPVARLEEFLSLFHQAVYNVVVERLGDVKPIENPEGEKRPLDVRKFVAAVNRAAYAAQHGYQTTPYYCEVDYFFWIVSGTVFFGCVLPSSEKVENFAYYTWKEKGKRLASGLKWVKTPFQIVKKGNRMTPFCVEGSIPSYVKLVSFKPGAMIGLQEVARRMVRDSKQRAWAIRYVLQQMADEVREKRTGQAFYSRQDAEKRTGGARLIADERYRQTHEEGHTNDWDDLYDKWELLRAAREYAKPRITAQTPMPTGWPWGEKYWKPSDDEIKNLRRAGALIAAEMDRVLRERAKVTPAKIMQGVIEKENFGV